ncbi:MAG: hypothetical protein LC776_00820 [Acidobacteria bacterium]|nr:hypothetical protein [Acidobacteriota bacterium]
MTTHPHFQHLESAYQLHFYVCFKTHYLRRLFAGQEFQADRRRNPDEDHGQDLLVACRLADGRLIACYYVADEMGLQTKLAIIPFEGGPPVKVFDIISQLVRWTPDGRSLTYIVDRSGVSNIWRQPLDGGPPTQLTDFKTDRVFWFDWSRDAKKLAFVRGVVSSDVVQISDIKR